ncbi:MAG: hypothetical protein V4446_00965 [Pseudomonadota bacterium]
MKRLLLIILLISPLTHADGLSGRLFYTPAERVQLEAGRDRPTPAPADSPAPTPDTLYNGYVQRSDGRATQWINGEPRQLQQLPASSGKLKLPATPALKPGQQYDTQSGRVLEPYERAVQPITPPVTPTQPAAPVSRKSLRNPLLDGDDASDDSRNDTP